MYIYYIIYIYYIYIYIYYIYNWESREKVGVVLTWFSTWTRRGMLTIPAFRSPGAVIIVVLRRHSGVGSEGIVLQSEKSWGFTPAPAVCLEVAGNHKFTITY